MVLLNLGPCESTSLNIKDGSEQSKIKLNQSWLSPTQFILCLRGPEMKVDSFQVVTDIKKATSLFHGRNIMDCNTRLELTAKN